MKIYCRFCGQGVDYDLKAPSICGYCGKAYAQATSNIQSQQPAQAVWQLSPSITNRRVGRNQAVSFNFSDQDDNEEDLDSVENLDLDNLGDRPTIEFAKAERVSGSKLVGTAPKNSSPLNVQPRPDNQKPEIKKAGRPKKTSKQDILKEFQAEAGTYKQNQKKQ